MKYSIEASCKSVTGKVRKNNEDNYFFNYKNLKEDNDGSKTSTMIFDSTDNVVAAVFDGMGGEERGERASFLASHTLKEYMQNTDKSFSWSEYIEKANDVILEEMPKNVSMGTTVAGIIFTEKYINICNLGDSRIYGFKEGKIRQLSYDHTEENIKKKLGIESMQKSRLMQHLGIKKEDVILEPYIKKIKYDDLEKIMICSDGLTDMLTDEEISKILRSSISSKKDVENLIEVALEKGGIDNTTVMIFSIKKKRNSFIKYILFGIVFSTLILTITYFLLNDTFRLTKDEYAGPITVGDSYVFSYKGEGEVSFSEDILKYENGIVYAIKEGNTTLTVKNKKGEILYEKTIKVFPK